MRSRELKTKRPAVSKPFAIEPFATEMERKPENGKRGKEAAEKRITRRRPTRCGGRLRRRLGEPSDECGVQLPHDN